MFAFLSCSLGKLITKLYFKKQPFLIVCLLPVRFCRNFCFGSRGEDRQGMVGSLTFLLGLWTSEILHYLRLRILHQFTLQLAQGNSKKFKAIYIYINNANIDIKKYIEAIDPKCWDCDFFRAMSCLSVLFVSANSMGIIGFLQ